MSEREVSVEPPKKLSVGARLKELFFGPIPVEVARSLREEAANWTSDTERMGSPFVLAHKSGLELWVANSAYGMEVRTEWPRCRTLWGGVGLLSCIGLSPGHHYLRHAANRWIREHDDCGAASAATVASSRRPQWDAA